MKKFSWLLLIVLVVGVLTACGSDESSGEVKGASGSSSDASVAVVLKTLSSPYWKYVEAGAKKLVRNWVWM